MQINADQDLKKVPIATTMTYDVCSCTQTAIDLIEQAIFVRESFSSIDELKSDKKAKIEIMETAKQFVDLTEQCFTKNAAKLFIPSDCNDVKLLETKQNKLIGLGIRINLGSKVWK